MSEDWFSILSIVVIVGVIILAIVGWNDATDTCASYGNYSYNSRLNVCISRDDGSMRGL